jgi:hypothetical protein
MPSFTETIATRANTLTCSAVVALTAATTIDMIINITWTGTAVRGTGTGFQFRAIRIA